MSNWESADPPFNRTMPNQANQPTTHTRTLAKLLWTLPWWQNFTMGLLFQCRRRRLFFCLCPWLSSSSTYGGKHEAIRRTITLLSNKTFALFKRRPTGRRKLFIVPLTPLHPWFSTTTTAAAATRRDGNGRGILTHRMGISGNSSHSAQLGFIWALKQITSLQHLQQHVKNGWNIIPRKSWNPKLSQSFD